jgi:ABC-type uncharacterized transport system permease subunit
MDQTILLISTVSALAGAVWGGIAVYRGQATCGTLVCMVLAFLSQLWFLKVRGELRGACPLRDTGEILAFLAWALTLFYLVVGPSYRLSVLGLFTAPVVAIFQGVALLVPGMMQDNPQRRAGVDVWSELHSAVSVLAYGAFALAAVASVMFLVLDHLLKEQHLRSGLFRRLPPARELLHVQTKLLWMGIFLLSIGLFAGSLMPHKGAWQHFVAAIVVWLSYAALLGISQWRGLTGRRISLLSVGIFVMSLLVFWLV